MLLKFVMYFKCSGVPIILNNCHFRSVPDYYSTVADPIDMATIQQKIKVQEYEDVEQMSTDIELLVNNAKSFYLVGWMFGLVNSFSHYYGIITLVADY